MGFPHACPAIVRYTRIHAVLYCIAFRCIGSGGAGGRLAPPPPPPPSFKLGGITPNFTYCLHNELHCSIAAL